MVVAVLSVVITVVIQSITSVVQSATTGLIYLDLRMRKEGLDLELLRYVEAKQSGAPGVDNPYLRLQGVAVTPPTQAGSPWA